MKNKYSDSIKSLIIEQSVLKNHSFIEEQIWTDESTLYLSFVREREGFVDFLRYVFSLNAKSEVRTAGIQKYVICPDVNKILDAAKIKDMSRYNKLIPYHLGINTVAGYPNFDTKNEFYNGITTNASVLATKSEFNINACKSLSDKYNEFIEVAVLPFYSKIISYQQITDEIIKGIPIQERVSYFGQQFCYAKQLAVLSLSSKRDYFDSKEEILSKLEDSIKSKRGKGSKMWMIERYQLCLRVCEIVEEGFEEM